MIGGRDEYEGKDCWGCQQHINTHLAAGGDLRFLPTFFFCLSSDKLELQRLKNCQILPMKEKACTRRESCRTDRHAKLMPPACRSPQLYKFALCICDALFTALHPCVYVDVSQLGTAGVLRDEEESVSPLYLKREMIGILMDCAGQSTSNAQTHLFSNQEDVMWR